MGKKWFASLVSFVMFHLVVVSGHGQTCYLTHNEIRDGKVYRVSAKVLLKDSEKELLIQSTRFGDEYVLDVIYRQSLRYGNPVNMTVEGEAHSMVFTLSNGDVCKVRTKKSETVRSKTVGREIIEYANAYSLGKNDVQLLSKYPVQSITLECYGVQGGLNTDDVLLKIDEERANKFLQDIACIGKEVFNEQEAEVKSDIRIDQVYYLDVVTLKDGTIVRGVIIQQVPNKALKIKTTKGSEHIYEASEVVSIVKEENLEFAVATNSNSVDLLPKEQVSVESSVKADKAAVTESNGPAEHLVKISQKVVTPEPTLKAESKTSKELVSDKDILTNEKIIQLTQRGMASSVIIAMIQGGQTKFDNSYSAILELNDKKVDADVITLMMEKASESVERQAAQVNKKDPNSMHASGIYLRVDDAENPLRQLLPSRFSNTTSGGASIYGFGGGSAWTQIGGLNSRVQVKEEFPEFYFYFDPSTSTSPAWFRDAISPADFELVKLRDEDGVRKIKIGGSSSGPVGGSSSSGIPAEFKIDFEIIALSPGVFKVKPNEALKGGEYGFIYIGDFEKVFDFGKPKEERKRKK